MKVPTTAIMFRMAVLSVLLFVAACYDERRVADSIKPLTREMTDVEWAADIPTMFDARDSWPDCPSIGKIRDQGSCGSCWAFGAVEAISDRICIASSGKITADISAEDLLTCCDLSAGCGFGCDGGFPNNAWKYWKENGLVTGGLFNGTGCKPYTIPPCEHHAEGPLPSCEDVFLTPNCTEECVPAYGKNYTEDKIYGKDAYGMKGDDGKIQMEILFSGPVQATFTVYADFQNYTSGVYQHHSTKQLGAHSVKIIGWGEEGGVKYWLAANSWNQDWGDKGFFKILRGTNECGIEDYISAGIPDV